MVVQCALVVLAALVALQSRAASAANWDRGDDDYVPMVNVEAVLGHRATLPCDISANRTDDRVQMVMWFQVLASKPLFTFDVRGRTFDEALTWSDAKALGPRAHFSASSRPAALTVDGVVLDDAGVYRCRADFSNSATRNSRVNLTVIVPPHSMAVYDISGKKVNSSIGPLLEGDNLVLKCEVRGGRPEPTVTWFANGRLMDGTVDASTPKVIVNRLDVHRVSRAHLNTTYRCQASNTRLIDPRHQDVRLDLKLKPLSVRLYPRPAHVPADDEARFECVTHGSRPQAVVTWWKTRHGGHGAREEQHFGAPHVDTRDNETMAWSVLTFRPKAADNNATIRCHADNPHLDNVGLEDSFTLNVVHPPVVELHLGDTLNPSNIKEGDDVYFECSIHSNPPKHRITWFHNGQPVLHNLSQGVILSSKSLVLQRVTRRQAGGYTCHASNERGNTTSRPVHLRVKFAPVCKTDGVVVVGAALQEHLRVRCRVAADPADDVSFFWQFNNSGNTYDVQESRPGPMTADLEYTALSERDYGTLACWASNEVGRQQEPCMFRVVQASPPGAVTNCSLLASGQAGRVDVSCLPGHPGGLPQWFSLILLEPRSGRILFNSTTGEVDAEPLWSLDPSILSSAVSAARAPVSLMVRAHNLKGQSPPAVLDDKLARAGIARQQIPADLMLGGDGSGMVGIAAVVLGVLLPLGLVALAVVVCIVRRRNALGLTVGLDNKVSHNGVEGPGHGPGHKGGLPSSRRNSSLEINDGDQRYVVSYTLKATASATPGGAPGADRSKQHLRPDILNTPRALAAVGADTAPTPHLARPDSLFPDAGPGAGAGASAALGVPGSLVAGTLGRRPHAVTSPISPGGGLSPGVRSHQSVAAVPSLPSPPDRAPSLGTSASATHQTLNGSLRRTKGLFNSIPGPESCV